MMMPIRSLESPQSCLILNVRSHHLTHQPISRNHQSVEAEGLWDVDDPLAECDCCPEESPDEVGVVLVERGSAPHLFH